MSWRRLAALRPPGFVPRAWRRDWVVYTEEMNGGRFVQFDFAVDALTFDRNRPTHFVSNSRIREDRIRRAKQRVRRNRLLKQSQDAVFYKLRSGEMD